MDSIYICVYVYNVIKEEVMNLRTSWGGDTGGAWRQPEERVEML